MRADRLLLRQAGRSQRASGTTPPGSPWLPNGDDGLLLARLLGGSTLEEEAPESLRGRTERHVAQGDHVDPPTEIEVGDPDRAEAAQEHFLRHRMGRDDRYTQ